MICQVLLHMHMQGMCVSKKSSYGSVEVRGFSTTLLVVVELGVLGVIEGLEGFWCPPQREWRGKHTRYTMHGAIKRLKGRESMYIQQHR